MFTRLFKRIAQAGRPQPTPISRPPLGSLNEAGTEYDPDLPSEPANQRGLPYRPVEVMLRRERKLIELIRDDFEFTRDQFDYLILPLIEANARFVGLLPASEHHHHRHTGGLFQHNLEVAFNAARRSGDFVFAPHAVPKERRNLEIRWKAASFAGGLMHDAGKPIANLLVHNYDGTQKWHPFEMPLLEWCDRNRLERYWLVWNPSREEVHKKVGAPSIPHLLTREFLVWLREFGDDPYRKLLVSVGGHVEQHPLFNIISQSDEASVAKNLRLNNDGTQESGTLGLPGNIHIIAAIRHLLETGKWTVNQPGSQVWLIDDGTQRACYVAWKKNYNDIVDVTREMRVPAIPANFDTGADVMLGSESIVPKQAADGQSYRYWPLAPHVLNPDGRWNVKMLCVRMKSIGVLFDEPPEKDDFVYGKIDPMPECVQCGQPHGVAVRPGKAWTCAGCGGVNDPKGALVQTGGPAQTPQPMPVLAGAKKASQPSPPIGATVPPTGPASPVSSPLAPAAQAVPSRPVAGGAPVSSAPHPSTGAPLIEAAPVAHSSQPDLGEGGSGLPAGGVTKPIAIAPKGNTGSGGGFWFNPAANSSLEVGNKTRANVQAADHVGALSSKGARPIQAAAHDESARRDLLAYGLAGNVLVAMCDDIAAGHRAWGDALVQFGAKMLIRSPEGAELYGSACLEEGQRPRSIRETLDLFVRAGLHVLPDATVPNKVLTEVAGARGLCLRPDIALLIERTAGSLPPAVSDTGDQAVVGPPIAPTEPLECHQAPTPLAVQEKAVDGVKEVSQPPDMVPELQRAVIAVRGMVGTLSQAQDCPRWALDEGDTWKVPIKTIEASASKSGFTVEDFFAAARLPEFRRQTRVVEPDVLVRKANAVGIKRDGGLNGH